MEGKQLTMPCAVYSIACTWAIDRFLVYKSQSPLGFFRREMINQAVPVGVKFPVITEFGESGILLGYSISGRWAVGEC